MAKPVHMIVDGSLADNTIEIASYIDSQAGESTTPYVQLAEELRSTEDSAAQQDLYFSLAEASSVLARAPVHELEPAFNLLVYVLSNAPDFDALLPVVLANLTADAGDVPATTAQQLVTLAILGNIFNVLPESSARRFDVFTKIVDYAAATATLGQLVPQLPQLVEWLPAWGVDASAREDLYTKVYELIVPAYPAESYRLLVDASRLGSGARLAERLVKVALETPSVYSFGEIVALPAVQELAASPASKPTWDLLQTVYLGDYAAFAKTEAASNPQITAKVRALALTALAQQNRKLAYADIAAATGVPEAEVEVLIIDAIKAKLVEGRMDQLGARFVVERASVVGEMKTADWQKLDEWLAEWKTALLETKKAVKSAGTHAERLKV